MDREFQIKELAKIIERHHIGCNIKKDCNTECSLCAAQEAYEIGWRVICRE